MYFTDCVFFNFIIISMNKLAHPEGEKNSSRAALKNNIIFNLSTLSTTTIKEVAESTECKALNWY